MKNQYSKFVKHLEKQDSVFLQCSGDYIYLTDGKIVLKVPGTGLRRYDSPIGPGFSRTLGTIAKA